MIGGGKRQKEKSKKFAADTFYSFPFAFFLLALAVRLPGLTWGLPNAGRWYSYHPDESTHQIVGAVSNLLQGGFNPHFFNYPSLGIYLATGVYYLLAVLGLTTPAAPESYPWPLVRDIIFAGRLVSAVLGAATAPLVFLVARELGFRRAAILAGILAALLPGHVQHSHFATVDVPATFFVVWCVFLTVRAKNGKDLLWAALVAGLAAATKYNAILVLIAPILQVWQLAKESSSLTPLPLPLRGGVGGGVPTEKVIASLNFPETPSKGTPPPTPPLNDKGRGVRPLLFTISLLFIALLGFFLGCPFAFFAPREWWGDGKMNGFAYELFVHPREGSGDIFQNTGNGWWYHFSFNLPFVMTWPLVIAAVLGIYFAAKNRRLWPILAFVWLYFLSLGFSQVRFMRYLLPLAPVLCLFAAYGASRMRWKFLSAATLVVFALWGTKDVLWPLTHPDPRDRAMSPLEKVKMQKGVFYLVNNPWFFTPPLQPQGFNRPVPGLSVIGFDVEKAPHNRRAALLVSEFEWRENVRLAPNGPAARFFQGLKQRGVQEAWVQVTLVPFALPGRNFVPHDFLYTNPKIRVFLWPEN